MKTTFAIFFTAAFLLYPAVSQTREVLVRKRAVPGFFMPDDAIKQPQRYFPTPQYTSGEQDTVREIKGPESKIPKKAKTVIRKQEMPQITQTANAGQNTPAKNNTVNSNGTPEYQMKYQEYLDSLKYVAAGQKIPRDQVLENDLAQMKSDERTKIDERILKDQDFNAHRTTSSDLEQAFSQREKIENRQRNIIDNLGSKKF